MCFKHTLQRVLGKFTRFKSHAVFLEGVPETHDPKFGAPTGTKKSLLVSIFFWRCWITYMYSCVPRKIIQKRSKNWTESWIGCLIFAHNWNWYGIATHLSTFLRRIREKKRISFSNISKIWYTINSKIEERGVTKNQGLFYAGSKLFFTLKSCFHPWEYASWSATQE